MRCVLILFVACAGPPPSSPSVDVAGPGDAAVLEPDASGSSSNAPEVFADGQAAFDRQDYARAEAIFRDLVRKFAYSRYAKKAELRIADIYFAQGKWLAARAAYVKWAADHHADEDEMTYVKERLEAIDRH